MARITIIIATILLSLASRVSGQQDVYFSQYMFDKMLVNPAYTASSKWLVGSLKNRTMVSEIEGVPLTNIFTFQFPWQSKNVGLGLKAIQDKIAVTNQIQVTGIFSYHIGFGNGKLSFGLEGGINNNNYNYSELVRIIQIDPAIPDGNESVIIPDISTGIYYQTEKFYIGAAAYHLFSLKNTVPDFEHNNLFKQEKNYYLLGGVPLEISRDAFIEPGFLLKYVKGAPIQADINILYVMVDKFSTGLSYRTGDAVSALVKFDLTKNLKIMYSYDYTLSPLMDYSKGNHEFGLSYGIEMLPPPSKKVIHPRYYF